MAGVPLGGEGPEVEHEVVAVRPDQADPALELLGAVVRERVEQPGLQQLAAIGAPAVTSSPRLLL